MISNKLFLYVPRKPLRLCVATLDLIFSVVLFTTSGKLYRKHFLAYSCFTLCVCNTDIFLVV